MKRAPQQAPTVRELKEYPAYAEASGRSDRLSSALAEVKLRIEKLKIRSSRLSTEAKRYLTLGVRVISSDQALEEACAKIISTGSVPRELMEKLRSGAHKPPFTDSTDLEMILEIEDAYAEEQLLGRAIALQKREVLRQKNFAIADICNNLQGERERIARTVASAFLQFAAALRDEYEFTDRLRAQDAAIPPLLSPGPFPVPLSSNPAALQWIAQVVGISDSEAEGWLKNADPSKMLQAAK